MKFMKTGLAACAITAAAASSAAAAGSVCLITKDATNPFFVKMAEGAFAKAASMGLELRSFAGRFDGDHETQVAAIETCVASGVNGILLAASDTSAIVDSVMAAREAGLLVIALDTPLEPIDAADMTFATDNFEAGRLIGEWAAGTVDADAARIGMINLNVSQPSVDVLRNQGFLTGFGIDVGDVNRWGDETDPRIAGQDVGSGNADGGRSAMENLLAIDPSINLVYTINEPSAAGAFEALRAFGRTDGVTIVSVDGGCPGVQDVAAGVIGATSQQYPLRMASLGVEAVANFIATGELPQPTDGKDFFDTGVGLITNAPVDGVESLSVEEGLALCWG